jgi:signal transduction histidine kinase
VLRNLLTNAMKYTEGNWVTVSSEVRSNAVHFRIVNEADTSDKGKWERVWEPFFVMEESRSKQLCGIGLGLSITDTILQKHHASYGHKVGDDRVEFYFSIDLIKR